MLNYLFTKLFEANHKNKIILMPVISVLCDINYLLTYLLTHSLTHSMVQNIIWKAECHSAYQKISRFMEPITTITITIITGPYPQPAESSLPHRSLSP
jgi:hypothetical protein